ncbi:MAG: accessory gene regulator ArgB-like protein, partial [Methylocystaceae bacterium]
MVKQISDYIGINLAKQLAYEQPQAEVLSYGMQIVIETTLEVAVLLFIAALLDIVVPTLIVFLVYAGIRTIGGGAHLSTFPRCLTVGCIMIIGFSALSTIPLSAAVNIILILAVVALGTVCIILWVPAGTEKKSITEVKIRKEQKKKLILVYLGWLLGILYLHIYGYQIYEQAAIYGSLVAFLIITPGGYEFFKALDNTL